MANIGYEKCKHELTNIELFEENGCYYLKLKYRLEREHCVEELEIPKAKLPFNKNVYPSVTYSECSCDPINDPRREESYLRTGFNNSLELRKGNVAEAKNVYCVVRTIEEKYTEMTVEEIEKKLGYKIKIVSEKGGAE